MCQEDCGSNIQVNILQPLVQSEGRNSSTSSHSCDPHPKRQHDIDHNHQQRPTYHVYTSRSTFFFLGCTILVAHIFFGDARPSSRVDSSPSPISPESGRNRFVGKVLSRLQKRSRNTKEVLTDLDDAVAVDVEESFLVDIFGRKQRRKQVETPPMLERGKVISNYVTGKELFEAYRQIREEYHTKAMSKDYIEKWNILKETDDGVQIGMLQHPSDPTCPYVRMVADMPGEVNDVWDFLELDNWEESMPKMDPFYAGLTILGKYTHRPHARRPAVNMVLARKRTKRIVTFGKRDFTFVSVSDIPQSNGVRVSGTVSVVTPKFPREKNFVRAFQDSVAFYESLPNDSILDEPRSRLTIVCRIDLNDSSKGGEGGNIPMWIYVKTIGQSGVLSMNNMKAELRKRLDTKLAAIKKTPKPERRRIPWLNF